MPPIMPLGAPAGRPPYPLSSMLRVHVMQVIYNLSDPAMEDALYEIESMRHFAGIRLSRVPDETTILNFRHLLEQHSLGKKLFKKINRQLARHGLMVREGSIVDATIIEAPRSTKNRDKARDPERHQTEKGAISRSTISKVTQDCETLKASVRAKVEHPFRMIKGVFGYGKVRYRGLAKNTNRLYVLAGLFNLLRVKRMLLP